MICGHVLPPPFTLLLRGSCVISFCLPAAGYRGSRGRRHSSQVSPSTRSCKPSDPPKVIPYGASGAPGPPLLSHPLTANIINRLISCMIWPYESSHAGVKKTFYLAGGVVFPNFSTGPRETNVCLPVVAPLPPECCCFSFL